MRGGVKGVAIDCRSDEKRVQLGRNVAINAVPFLANKSFGRRGEAHFFSPR